MRDLLARSRPTTTVPGRLAALLLNRKHIAPAACLNFPGNSILGGGGGLALLCGLSRQFTWHGFVLTVAIATSPIPVLVLAGWLDLEPLMEQHRFLHDVLTWIESPFIHEQAEH